MSNLLSKYKEVILYLVFGVLTTAVNIVVYYIFNDMLGIHYLAANAVAWVLSVLFAYITNRIWVFESRNTAFSAVAKEIMLFTGCRLFSGVVDMGVMFVGVDVLLCNSMIMKVISNVIVVVMNYVFSKLLIFKK